MATLNCGSPGTLLASSPCLRCESQTELKAFQARTWALANGLDVSNPAVVASLMQSSECLTVLSPKQIAQAVIEVDRNRFDTSTKTFAQKRNDVRQLANLSQHQLDAIILYLKCSYFNAH